MWQPRYEGSHGAGRGALADVREAGDPIEHARPGTLSDQAPHRHRVAILTWIGIWPTVSMLLYFGSPHLNALAFLARTAAITATAVLVMS
jgi:hypothetical protein